MPRRPATGASAGDPPDDGLIGHGRAGGLGMRARAERRPTIPGPGPLASADTIRARRRRMAEAAA